MIKNLMICLSAFLPLCLNAPIYAQDNGIGQILQINTNLSSFVGRPSWLIIIRDIDNNQNIPYLYDIQRGINAWMAFTNSAHYLITVSQLQISTYRSYCNDFRNYTINNFCHLESNGRIIRGQSMYITLSGDLSPYSHAYTCRVSRFFDPAPQPIAMSQ